MSARSATGSDRTRPERFAHTMRKWIRSGARRAEKMAGESDAALKVAG